MNEFKIDDVFFVNGLKGIVIKNNDSTIHIQQTAKKNIAGKHIWNLSVPQGTVTRETVDAVYFKLRRIENPEIGQSIKV